MKPKWKTSVTVAPIKIKEWFSNSLNLKKIARKCKWKPIFKALGSLSWESFLIYSLYYRWDVEDPSRGQLNELPEKRFSSSFSVRLSWIEPKTFWGLISPRFLHFWRRFHIPRPLPEFNFADLLFLFSFTRSDFCEWERVSAKQVRLYVRDEYVWSVDTYNEKKW